MRSTRFFAAAGCAVLLIMVFFVATSSSTNELDKAPMVSTAEQASSAGAETTQPSISPAESFDDRARIIPLEKEAQNSAAAWQYQYGFRIPDKYSELNEAQLAKAAQSGDPYASQRLAEITWNRTGSRDAAAAYYVSAIEYGSVGAIGELVTMYDPEMAPGLSQYYESKFGRSLEPNLKKAYLWARTATYRGDLDAMFAIDRLKQSLSPKEIAALEIAAYDNFMTLKGQHLKLTGRPMLPMDSDDQRKFFARAAAAGG